MIDNFLRFRVYHDHILFQVDGFPDQFLRCLVVSDNAVNFIQRHGVAERIIGTFCVFKQQNGFLRVCNQTAFCFYQGVGVLKSAAGDPEGPRGDEGKVGCTSVIVTAHGALIKGLMQYLGGRGNETFWEGNPSGNCAMTVLDCTDGVLSVECEGKDIVSEVDLKKNFIYL